MDKWKAAQLKSSNTIKIVCSCGWCWFRPIKQIDVLSLQTTFTECVCAIVVSSQTMSEQRSHTKTEFHWNGKRVRASVCVRVCVRVLLALLLLLLLLHIQSTRRRQSQHNGTDSVKLFKRVCGKWLRRRHQCKCVVFDSTTTGMSRHTYARRVEWENGW